MDDKNLLIEKLQFDLEKEREYVRLLKAEIAFVENGYKNKIWNGLTSEEYEEILKEQAYWYEIAKAIENKLKEKNCE